ncbi:aminopeptidase P family protein [Myroides sp. LJL115]
MFDTQTYINRRQALKKNFPQGGILLFLGNIENPINFRDNTYRFRQDSTFLYYFGISAPYLAAIIDLDQDKTIVFGDEMSMDLIVWMGRQQTLEQKSLLSGVNTTLPFNQLKDYLSKAIATNREVHYLPAYQSYNQILLSDLLHTPIKDLKASVSFIKAVVQQRQYKEPQEIEQIEKALAVSVDMHLLAMRMTRPGVKEYEISSAITHLAASRNCELAYPSIVTIHGEILHNHYQQNTLKPGELLLNDSGAEVASGYASDLTRTIPVSDTFSPVQAQVYNIVLESFNQAKAMLKPGTSFKDIHLHASKVLCEGLIDMGIMKGNAQDAVDNHAHTMFFQCGLGHMMGLDVHDMEDLGEQYVGYTDTLKKETQQFGLKSLRLGKELEKGHVVTIEPGIYFIPELISRWSKENKYSEFINYDRLNDFVSFGGIRIEDNFLIESSSYRLLGPELIKTVKDIEQYRADHR